MSTPSSFVAQRPQQTRQKRRKRNKNSGMGTVQGKETHVNKSRVVLGESEETKWAFSTVEEHTVPRQVAASGEEFRLQDSRGSRADKSTINVSSIPLTLTSIRRNRSAVEGAEAPVQRTEQQPDDQHCLHNLVQIVGGFRYNILPEELQATFLKAHALLSKHQF